VIVEEISRRYGAALVVGNAHRGKDRMASNVRKKSEEWDPPMVCR